LGWLGDVGVLFVDLVVVFAFLMTNAA